MSIQLDPALVAAIQAKVPRALLLVLAAAFALPGAALGGWFLYCEKFSGEELLTRALEEGEALEVDLTPEMNPISVSVGRPLQASTLATGERGYELSVTEPSAEEVLWSERFSLSPSDSQPGTSVRVGPQALDPTTSMGLGTLTVRTSGPHSLWLKASMRGVERGFDPEVMVSLRANARTFSMLWGILGLAMLALGIGVGAIALPQARSTT